MAIISRGLLGAAAALTAVTLLAACGGRLPEAMPQQPVSDPAPVPSTTPPPTYLSDSQYTAALAAINRPVTAALAKVATGSALSYLITAAEVLNDASGKVNDLDVSPAVSDDNALYAGDLTAVADDLTTLSTGVDAEGSTACTAANPAVEVGQESSVSTLASQSAQLAAGGHPTGLALPKFPKQQNRTLANGTFLRNTDRNGDGRLTVENGGTGNAVITLKRNGARSLSIYLRKNGKYTIKGMRDGTYTVYFATGSDWDAKRKGFTSGCDYEKFDKSLAFKTSYHSTYIEYTTYTLSLYATVGGNASTSGVAPGKFPAP